MQNPSPEKIADTYIENNLVTLGVSMDNSNDSLHLARQLYNQGDLQGALHQFESILQTDSTKFTAIKYAGIVCLRLENFDKALNYFARLERHPGLFSNPGKFYRALTLMKRHQPGDIELAKKLLDQVVQLQLEGKNTASVWLKKL